jgi:DNA helicase TIP49 (TBP-interacting protein)
MLRAMEIVARRHTARLAAVQDVARVRPGFHDARRVIAYMDGGARTLRPASPIFPAPFIPP